MNNYWLLVILATGACKSVRSNLSSPTASVECNERWAMAAPVDSNLSIVFKVRWDRFWFLMDSSGHYSFYDDASEKPVHRDSLQLPRGFEKAQPLASAVMRRKTTEDQDVLILVYREGILFFAEVTRSLPLASIDPQQLRLTSWRLVGQIGKVQQAGSLIPTTTIEAFGFDELHRSVLYSIVGDPGFYYAAIKDGEPQRRNFLHLDLKNPIVQDWRRQAKIAMRDNYRAAIQSLRTSFVWPRGFRPQGQIFADQHGQMIVTQDARSQWLCLRFASHKSDDFAGPSSLACSHAAHSGDIDFVSSSQAMISEEVSKDFHQSRGYEYGALFSAFAKPNQKQGLYYARQRSGLLTRRLPQVTPRAQRPPEFMADAGILNEYYLAEELLSQAVPEDRFRCPVDSCAILVTPDGLATIRNEAKQWKLARFRRDDAVPPGGYLYAAEDEQQWPADLELTPSFRIYPSVRGWSYINDTTEPNQVKLGHCPYEGRLR